MSVVGLVAAIAAREEWMDEAACASSDPEAFYPNVGEDAKRAKRICFGCPVQQDCLRYALERCEPHGIWGGVTARDRRRMRAQKPVRPEKCMRGHVYAEVGRRADGSCTQCRRDRQRRYDASRRRIA